MEGKPPVRPSSVRGRQDGHARLHAACRRLAAASVAAEAARRAPDMASRRRTHPSRSMAAAASRYVVFCLPAPEPPLGLSHSPPLSALPAFKRRAHVPSPQIAALTHSHGAAKGSPGVQNSVGRSALPNIPSGPCNLEQMKHIRGEGGGGGGGRYASSFACRSRVVPR